MTAPMGSGSFNPNDAFYRSCCCHTKTFTIVAGILEIFFICFILVAIIPDVNSRVCEGRVNSSNVTLTPLMIGTATSDDFDVSVNTTEEFESFMTSFRESMCDMSIAFLAASIADIISINIMFYAIKSIRWVLFIPHIFFRILTIFAFVCGICVELYTLIEGGPNNTTLSVGIFFTGLGCFFWFYILIAEFKCAHFIKRSQETGYSISVARPIGPATISLSEREAPQQNQQDRQLPPLRHTYGGNPAQKYADQ